MNPPRTIVVDFDGTLTVDDMLDRVCREFGDPRVYAEVDAAFDRGEIRLVDDIERKLASVRSPLGDVVAWLLIHTRLRAGFAELASRARDSGWGLVVVSSSFHELIEPVLAAHGVDVEVRANRLEARPDGWRAHFSFGDACEACGEPCKRGMLDELAVDEVVYAGDGYSDRCAARTADRIFARAGLARHLDRERVPYEHFDDFRDVERALDAGQAAA